MKLSAKLNLKASLDLFLTIIIIAGIGGLIGATSGSGASNNWYQTLERSSLNPPGFVFGIVWPILYALMGYAFWWVLQQKESALKNQAIRFFALQLSLNYSWSFIFFTYHMPVLSFVWILGTLWAAMLWLRSLLVMNEGIAKTQILYIAWLCFAAYLSGMIVILN